MAPRGNPCRNVPDGRGLLLMRARYLLAGSGRELRQIAGSQTGRRSEPENKYQADDNQRHGNVGGTSAAARSRWLSGCPFRRRPSWQLGV
jgi:hypothetical protein